MRALLQRVTHGKVTVEGRVTGIIQAGLVILLGIGEEDTLPDIEVMVSKILNLRIFSDTEGKFNLSALDVKAEILVISQFTLYADCRKGRRPGFTNAARPEMAAPMCDDFVRKIQAAGLTVQTGIFGAEMLIEIHNSGPVTIWLDSKELSGG
jgi:D-aminoacyl-tRNA deacylase